ncbi:hypothetical protein [Trichlorobacter ammonificans]|uniref:Uncharacterized protein n=1 Tax=Trichlorobacter ammonificans TaxID=2916410 RepID=A0ABN8HFN2_9BACT|nr:hypothetical protein [Trichlorobacter ammonificans]CAH2029953.1 conserved protein of unknown function [Trichlorobacter ammonificans]
MLEQIGSDLYKTWSDDQRRNEIGKLVSGYRSGLPLTILLQMATAIAGSPEDAREHLAAIIPAAERHLMVGRLKGEEQALAASFLM